MVVKEADVGRKKWLFAEKEEGKSNGRKRGAPRCAISGKCGLGSLRLFLPRADSSGALSQCMSVSSVYP
jgi:hypothetical protein